MLPPAIQRSLRKVRTSRQSNPIWVAARNLLFELRVFLTVFGSRRKLKSFKTVPDIKLNLGCGNDLRTGWLNIDVLPPSKNFRRKNRADAPLFIAHDFRRGLQLPDASCRYIYSSHLWEHLDIRIGFKLMKECYRILQQGGILRIALPNFERSFTAYLERDSRYFELIPASSLIRIPGAETLIDYVEYAIYQYGEHQCLYDEDRVCKMLTQAGFSKPHLVEFDPEVDVNTPLRTRYSFYVEAIR